MKSKFCMNKIFLAIKINRRIELDYFIRVKVCQISQLVETSVKFFSHRINKKLLSKTKTTKKIICYPKWNVKLKVYWHLTREICSKISRWFQHIIYDTQMSLVKTFQFLIRQTNTCFMLLFFSILFTIQIYFTWVFNLMIPFSTNNRK